MPVQHLKTVVTVIKNAILGAIAIWQLVQIGGLLDPFRGWQSPAPQVIAAVLLLTYFPARHLLRSVPKYRLKRWLGVALPVTVVFFFLSLNIVLGFNPGRYFLEPSHTLGRLQLTLAFYSLFIVCLAVVIALLDRLKPGG